MAYAGGPFDARHDSGPGVPLRIFPPNPMHLPSLVAAAFLFASPAVAAQSVLHELANGDPSVGFGTAVAGVADLDGDGVRDFAISSPSTLPLGTVSLHSGIDASVIRTIAMPGVASPIPGAAGYGESLAGVGDLNGDGVEDLAVGAPRYEFLSFPNGALHLVSGADGSTIAVSVSPNDGSEFGFSAAGLGDVNGDGTPDVLVSAPRIFGQIPERTGVVFVVSGTTGSTIYSVAGDSANGRFGHAVLGLADLDLDGIRDFAVGAPNNLTQGGTRAGSLTVHSGATGAELWRISGQTDGEAFGTSLARIDDIDGDGVDEIAVGAPGAPFGGATTGRVVIVSGQTSAIMRSIVNGQFESDFGRTVAGVSDLDGDGAGDLLVGAPLAGNGSLSGGAFLYSGATGAELERFLPGEPGEALGSALASAGDVDGDGFDELLIGSPTLAVNGVLLGGARIHLGRDAETASLCQDAIPNSTGLFSVTRAVGTSNVEFNRLTLQTDQLPPDAFGIYVGSQTPAPGIINGGLNARLCIGGDIGRFDDLGQVQQASTAGKFALSLDLMALPSPAGPISGMAGQTWYFQAWHRDLIGPFVTSNLSDSIRVTLR